MEKVNVTIYNEYLHEVREERIRAVYPKGIHGAIGEMLSRDADYNIRYATLSMPECGLTQDVLNQTDVLIWWGHMAHAEVPDEVALRVKQRVLEGMGLIVLHSGHASKPFKLLMGTQCRSKWRENDEKERIWVVEPGHRIAEGLPEYIELEQEETYGERFDIPAPDELVFISWFAGGEVFRSGCCYYRGLGRIFYFRPGHEEYPTYYRENVAKILHNAVEWARPRGITPTTFGNTPPLEKLPDKFAGRKQGLRDHTSEKYGGVA